MTLEKLLETNKLARAIYEECKRPRPGTHFCKYQFFHGLPGKGAPIGIKRLIQQQIPLEHREILTDACRAVAPGCKHEIAVTDECPNGESCEHSYQPEIPPPAANGQPYVDILIKDWLRLPNAEKYEKNYHLRRDVSEFNNYKYTPGFTSLLEGLRQAARDGGLNVEKKLETLQADGWHKPEVDGGQLISDLQEPLFVVNSIEDGKHFSRELHFDERWRKGELSRWYIRNAFYVIDAQTRKELMSMHLTKYTATGALSWKPVVMTFSDSELERKLSQVCTQVVTVVPVKDHDYLADVRLYGPKEIKEAGALATDDMPLECLDGWLGEVCRDRMLKDYPVAYAWPALLTAASVLVTKELLPSGLRANVYVGIIGPVGSGKTCVFNDAFKLLDLKDNPRGEVAETEIVRVKAGSGEGLAQKIGDQNSASKLVFVDELEHLMKKINIKGATFANTLDDAFTTDCNRAVVANRVEILFSVRLSLAGGVPEDGFAETFGAGTVTGLHSRFILAACPSNFEGYSWHPYEGEPALKRAASSEYEPNEGLTPEIVRPSRLEINPDVWTETKRWQKELKINGRAIEQALKTAMIAAAFDNRGTLTAAQLGPALAFAKYQDMMHRKFEPNPGKNDEAILTDKVMKYLHEKATQGEWIERRKMLHEIHAYDFGPSTVNRALQGMSMNNEIELGKVGRKQTVRLSLDRM